MITVTFVAADGTPHPIEADEGLSLMEVGRNAGVPGIIAECGGACACATCHVHVAPDWLETVGDADAMERDMLDFATDVGPTSRLSCQIKVTATLDGLVVSIPSAG